MSVGPRVPYTKRPASAARAPRAFDEGEIPAHCLGSPLPKRRGYSKRKLGFLLPLVKGANECYDLLHLLFEAQPGRVHDGGVLGSTER